jgi:hypothetical protein
MKKKGISRRELAAAAAAAAMPGQGQNARTVAQPGNDLESARAHVRERAAVLRKFKVDTLLEPSFVFRA